MPTLKELEASREAAGQSSLEAEERRWTPGPFAEPRWPPRSGSPGAVLRDGLAAGLLAYGATAVVVAVMDLAHGHSPLHTVAHLG